MVLHSSNTSSKCFLSFLACLLLQGSLISASSWSWAQAPSSSAHSQMASQSAQTYHLSKPVSSGFGAADPTALGERTPVVLIHGIGGGDNRLFNWENFVSFAQKQKAFSQKYKIYLYHYDSRRSVPAISENLRKTLRNFIGALDGRSIKIVAYSEGGLLVRNALQDPYLDEHTQEILAIATPFHGSPLANPDWINQQVRTESAFSPVRLGQKIAYRITGKLYPSFRQDFHWDNFDGAIPMEQYIQQNGPIRPTNYALAHKKNFVTYGSFFGTAVDPAILPRELDLKAPLPKERPSLRNVFRKNFLLSLIRNNIAQLPLAKRPHSTATSSQNNPKMVRLQGDTLVSVSSTASTTQHPPEPQAFMALATESGMSPDNPTLAGEPSPTDYNTILHPQASPLATRITPTALQALDGTTSGIVPAMQTALHTPIQLNAVSMMMFNDGISPISSTLWLGRYSQSQNGSMSTERLWEVLKALKGGKHARLFAGIDHRNWMDGTTRTGEELIQDLLNPDEKPRTVFDWILYDLMS